MKYPFWMTIQYTMFYKSSRKLGYTKCITSEKDLIEFIDRLHLEQSMVTELQINNNTCPVTDLTPIFVKVNQLQREEQS